MKRTSSTKKSSTKGCRDKLFSPEYYSWLAMLQRCLYPSHKAYHRYGGRGITICDRWREFRNFLEDMGPRPKGASLDRINNNGNYEPGNCRWATSEQQMLNQSVTFRVSLNGKSVALRRESRRRGLNPHKVYKRITQLGWSPEEALELVPRINPLKKHFEPKKKKRVPKSKPEKKKIIRRPIYTNFASADFIEKHLGPSPREERSA